MRGSDLSADASASYALITGAGGAGLTWTRMTGLLGARLFPLPDEESVAAMAGVLAPEIAALPEPRILAGASLGAMVSLEIARRVPVDALVLIAAGWGIAVSESLLDWVAANPPDLLRKMAKATIADRDDAEALEAVTLDFEARGQPVMLRHLTALAAYKPEPLAAYPPTLVIWGERDHSVPLADHAELALRCGGALAPVAGAAHKPYFEQPEETVRWIRWAARWAAAAAAARAATAPRPAGTTLP
jgi:pimeloyl-ACP methyl ester carboxylesterase